LGTGKRAGCSGLNVPSLLVWRFGWPFTAAHGTTEGGGCAVAEADYSVPATTTYAGMLLSFEDMFPQEGAGFGTSTIARPICNRSLITARKLANS